MNKIISYRIQNILLVNIILTVLSPVHVSAHLSHIVHSAITIAIDALRIPTHL